MRVAKLHILELISCIKIWNSIKEIQKVCVTLHSSAPIKLKFLLWLLLYNMEGLRHINTWAERDWFVYCATFRIVTVGVPSKHLVWLSTPKRWYFKCTLAAGKKQSDSFAHCLTSNMRFAKLHILELISCIKVWNSIKEIQQLCVTWHSSAPIRLNLLLWLLLHNMEGFRHINTWAERDWFAYCATSISL